MIKCKETVRRILTEFNPSIIRDEAGLNLSKASKRVVIDFSSPNIAKPFHLGHLKSTILGNFLANINQFVGHQVTRLNYIGDWGTQFGLLCRGLEKFGQQDIDSILKQPEPLRFLLDIYVKANKEGKENEQFRTEALRLLVALEGGTDARYLKIWKAIRDLSLEELKSSYARIGVNFDVFEFESDYVEEAKNVVKIMEQRNFISRTDDGASVAHLSKNGRMYKVPVIKSDGASLYLSRDVAAVFGRKAKYNFDRMLYVVGVDQEKHFHNVGEIVERMGHPDIREQLVHVKMAKMLGMSTRSGKVVLLSDIIDKVTESYKVATIESPTSKVKESSEALVANVGHHLALSALFVHDLRKSRLKHYEFSWDHLMKPGIRSGINLQTSLARLSSLLKLSHESGIEAACGDKLDLDAISCVDGVDLLNQLDCLGDSLHESYNAMDPSALVNYALDLCRYINRANRSADLRVMSETHPGYAETRLRLFRRAHQQLEFIIKMVGLTPLYAV